MKYLPGIFIIILSLFTTSLFAQQGEITGKVVDPATGEPVPFINVKIENEGTLTGGVTQANGIYSVKVPSGTYTVTASFFGNTQVIEGVSVSGDVIAEVNIELSSAILIGGDGVDIITYKIPLIDKFETKTGAKLDAKEIELAPTKKIEDLVALAPGVYKEDGKDLNIKGARAGATEYMIDGMRVMGNTDLPSGSIGTMEVITGGVPAKYGNCTGGMVIIETKSYY